MFSECNLASQRKFPIELYSLRQGACDHYGCQGHIWGWVSVFLADFGQDLRGCSRSPAHEEQRGWDHSSDDEDDAPEVGSSGGSAGTLALASAAVPKKPTSSLCRFHTCGASSDDARFQVLIGLNGEEPVGPYCLKCGMAAEAWPLMSKEEVENKVKTRADFRKDFSWPREPSRPP